ncbi:MAG: hypothetical protein WAU01_11130 [Saprospiraceae bacterium]
MKLQIIFLSIVALIACNQKESQIHYLEKSANFIENNLSHFDETRVNILRIPNTAKEIAYEFRTSNDPGFSIFEIKPQKKIIKNLTNTQLDSTILLKIDSLIKKDCFPILIEIKNSNKLLKFKVKENIYTLIKGDKVFESKLIANNKFSGISNKWKMIEQKYQNR